MCIAFSCVSGSDSVACVCVCVCVNILCSSQGASDESDCPFSVNMQFSTHLCLMHCSFSFLPVCFWPVTFVSVRKHSTVPAGL